MVHPVILFGADGTGKTVQANILLEMFEKTRFKSHRCWLRARHGLAYLVSLVLLKLGGRSMRTLRGGSVLDVRGLPWSKLWALLEFISVVPWVITRFYLPLLLGRRVVAERFVLDNIVYNEFFLGSSFEIYSRLLLRMIPRNAVLVHLDAEYRDALARKRNDLLSQDFLAYQLAAYRAWARRLGEISLNTSRLDELATTRRILEACEAAGR